MALSQPEQFIQPELNDLVRDLGLSKNQSELLASRLKDKNMLKLEARVTYFRNREHCFLQFFLILRVTSFIVIIFVV